MRCAVSRRRFRRDDARSAASINGRSTAAGTEVRFRKVIVGAQLALTLVLLAGAGLFVQTLARLYTRDRGFDSTRLLMFRADPAGTGSPASDAPLVMRELLQTLRDVPGVERVSLGNIGLLGSLGGGRVLTIESDQRIVTERPVPMMRIGAGFFSTLGVRLMAGREFDERDTLAAEKTGIRSIVVNESFARRYFGSLSPVGRRVGVGNQPDTPLNIEIVGVVTDFRRRFLRDDAEPEHIFVPFAQGGPLAGDGTIFVRVRGEPEAAFPSDPRRGGEDRSGAAAHQPDDCRGSGASPLEGRGDAGDAVERLRRRGAAAVGRRPVRRDVVRGDAAHAGNRHADGPRRHPLRCDLARRPRRPGHDRRGDRRGSGDRRDAGGGGRGVVGQRLIRRVGLRRGNRCGDDDDAGGRGADRVCHSGGPCGHVVADGGDSGAARVDVAHRATAGPASDARAGSSQRTSCGAGDAHR